jgi:hypothetical protein
VPRSRTVLMLKASFRCCASLSETPWMASTGASASSARLLDSYALSTLLAMSPTMVLPSGGSMPLSVRGQPLSSWRHDTSRHGGRGAQAGARKPRGSDQTVRDGSSERRGPARATTPDSIGPAHDRAEQLPAERSGRLDTLVRCPARWWQELATVVTSTFRCVRNTIFISRDSRQECNDGTHRYRVGHPC